MSFKLYSTIESNCTTPVVEYSEFDYIRTFTSWFYNFMCFLVYVHFFFFQFKVVPFSISCKTDLVVMNFLSFYISGKVYISPWFLKGSFAGYSIPGCWLLSFRTLNIASHSFLACKISPAKYTENLIIFLMCVRNCSSFGFSKFYICLWFLRIWLYLCVTLQILQLHEFRCPYLSYDLGSFYPLFL